MVIRQWYNKAPTVMAGTLFVVATPIGNLDDITARALRVLRSVSMIAAEDTRRTARLLAHYGIGTPTTSLHEHNEHQKAPALIERLQRGDDVALVSDAGTPTVSDPGDHLIRRAIEAGLRVEAVPGPSAILAALASSGFPAGPFSFVGFPPIRSKDRNDWFERVTAATELVVFFESPRRIGSTLEELRARVGDVDVAVGRELTKKHEELVRGPISLVLKHLADPKGEFTVVANLVDRTNIRDDEPSCAADIPAEFGRLTDSGGLTRRQAISRIAKRHGLSARAVYQELEQAKRAGST
jgi:16S rRNA (cytidine1402-2'-O)-methyltransferase